MGRLKTFLLFIAIAFSLKATNLVATYSPGSDRNDYTGYLGMRFYASSTFTVGSLGIRCANSNSGNHNVYVVDQSTSFTQVTNATINLSGCTTGTFYYANVSPVTITSGDLYFIVSQVTSGDGQNWADQGPVTCSALCTTLDATYTSSLTSVNGATANYSYIGVDLTDAAASSTPPRLTLLGVGFALFDKLFWRLQ